MRNLSDKCRENQNIHMSNNVFLKIMLHMR